MLVSEKAQTLKTTKIKSKLLLGRKPLQNKKKYLAGTDHQAIKISKLGLILIKLQKPPLHFKKQSKYLRKF